MKLTLDSLKKIDRTCDEISGIENLIDTNERLEINEKITSIHAMVATSTATIEKLQAMKQALDVNGYTDAWYNQLHDTGLINMVTLDMPKLFDNKANRTSVCQEGIGQTILEWLKKAWEIIKTFLGKLREYLTKLMNMLNIESKADNNLINQGLDFVDKKVKEYAAKGTPPPVPPKTAQVDPWYDPEEIKRHYLGCTNIFTLFKDSTELSNITMACWRNHRVDEASIKGELIGYLKRNLTKFGYIKTSDPNNGFIISDSRDLTSPIVLMYGVNLPGTKYVSHPFVIDDLQKIKDNLNALRDLINYRTNLVQELKKADADVKAQRDSLDGQLNFVISQTNYDKDEADKMVAAIKTYNVILPSVVSLLNYMRFTITLVRADILAIRKAESAIR